MNLLKLQHKYVLLWALLQMYKKKFKKKKKINAFLRLLKKDSQIKKN